LVNLAICGGDLALVGGLILRRLGGDELFVQRTDLLDLLDQ